MDRSLKLGSQKLLTTSSNPFHTSNSHPLKGEKKLVSSHPPPPVHTNSANLTSSPPPPPPPSSPSQQHASPSPKSPHDTPPAPAAAYYAPHTYPYAHSPALPSPCGNPRIARRACASRVRAPPRRTRQAQCVLVYRAQLRFRPVSRTPVSSLDPRVYRLPEQVARWKKVSRFEGRGRCCPRRRGRRSSRRRLGGWVRRLCLRGRCRRRRRRCRLGLCCRRLDIDD